ncbi:hypothetical protein RUM44_007240 [Polyplax serrata]|uniref:Carboxypeptidase Q n=1 Tax=Polyplax serrata TaxID=468196 RepID=A0ABR1B1T1_POLSC
MFKILLCAFLVSLTYGDDTCSVPTYLQQEIKQYQGLANKIVDAVINGDYKGYYYNDLELFIDTYGNRLTGTKNLEKSIDYIANKSTIQGLRVRMDPVLVPQWIRGDEQGFMVSPRMHKLKILGLGPTPGTETTGLMADVVVVSSFDELNSKASEVPGKIVLFNYEFTDYESTVQYRVKGPAAASKLGAVGALVRSVTPFSIGSPHTGGTEFGEEDKPIPAAAVTLEDADLLSRLYLSGQKVTVYLKMHAHQGTDQRSRNVVVDYLGETLPNQYMTVSGHIDSWDVGQGALDDGVGAFLALHTVYLLNTLSLKPKRTIRAILWTGEEFGFVGAKSYLNDHKGEFENWTAALEADAGSYNPLGLNFAGSQDAYCIMVEIAKLFTQLNSTTVMKTSSAGSDISVFKSQNVPLMEPMYAETPYYWFHHSDGDSMRTLNSDIMDKNLAFVAGVSYILADLSVQLPNGK